MAIELADNGPETGREDEFKAPRRMPPSYVVIRGASQTPEILHADSEDGALATVRRQVQSSVGATPVVFVYKMVAVVQFVAESKVLDPDSYFEQSTSPTEGAKNA